MDVRMIGVLISVTVIAVSAFMMGYGRGRDQGQDDMLDLIRDVFPDAWAVIENGVEDVVLRHEDRRRHG